MGLTVALMLLAFAPDAHACAATPAVVIDRGLHREWRIEQDCRHPERPAQLVEIPSTEPAMASRRTAPAPHSIAASDAPIIRPGMRVTIVSAAGISISGRALEPGSAGATIRVRADWSHATLRCVVRENRIVAIVKGSH